MKIRKLERTALFKTLVRNLGCYRGDPTSQELEKVAETRGRMLLIIKIRWIFLLSVSIYLLYAESLLLSSGAEHSHGIALIILPAGALLTAACYNLFYQLFYCELSHFKLVNHLQVLLDIIAITALVHYGGGIFNPFWAIYPFLALEACLLLEGRRAPWIFCITMTLAFGILIAADASEQLNLLSTPFIAKNPQQYPLISLLLWTWTAVMTVAATIIGSHIVWVSRRRELFLKQQAVMDQTTKLYNRGYFFKELNSEIQRSIRYDHIFSIIFLDIDHFKEFNDIYGHLEGDRALQAVAGILRNNVRRSETNPPYDIDVPCRYGGEEFGIILPETPISTIATAPSSRGEQNAAAFAERIREEIESLMVHGKKITASIGIASFPNHGNTPDELIKAADDALYQAKRTGRNRIVIAEGKAAPNQKGISSSGLNTGSSYPWEPTDPASSEVFPAP